MKICYCSVCGLHVVMYKGVTHSEVFHLEDRGVFRECYDSHEFKQPHDTTSEDLPF